MKHLKLFFACLLTTVLSIGQIWGAADVTYDFTGSDWSVSNGALTNGTVSFTGSGTNFKKNSGYFYLGKSGAYLTFPTYTSAVEKIVVTGNSGASASTEMNIYVGETAVSTKTTGSTGTNTYNIASANQAAGTTYTLKVVSNHNAQITKIEIYYAAETSGGSMTPDPTSVEVGVDGDDDGSIAISYTGISDMDNVDDVALYNDEDHTSAFTGNWITAAWNADKSAVEYAVEANTDAARTAYIYLYAIDDNGDDVETVIEVSQAKYTAPTGTFELYTSILAEGDYVIYYNGYAMKNSVTSGRLDYALVTPSNNAIANPDESIIWHIAQNGDYWTIYNAAVEKYAAGTEAKNKAQLLSEEDAGNKGFWTVERSNGTFDFTNYANTLKSVNATLRNNGTNGFACYATSTGGALSLYKKGDGKPSAPTFSPAGGSFIEAQSVTLSAADGASIYYTTDESTPTTSSTLYSGAIAVSSTTTITAIAVKGGVSSNVASETYTITPTEHAGTESDPYSVADAKIVIDALSTKESAYVSGVVSTVVTTTLPDDGYITFNISVDGTTTGQQIQAYKCKSLNGEAFTALSDVEAGATVVITGTLKKYNSTYEFDQNCHLVSYEAPAVQKQSIANDQANPYTVAQALVYAADGVTYDLDDYVYVRGVVYDVKSFNEGVMNIFIKDANAENQFELFKCAGINDGSATTPFEALSDVQVGNIVIGYGQLTVYNSVSEFKQGNYIVDFQKPVTGVQLNTTAEVEAGSTVNLTATILPSNATGTIDWSVTSGDAYASVDAGVVSGIAEGEAVIRATVQGTEIYAECSVTITEASTPVSYDYALVTDEAQLQDGLKVIIVAATADKAAGSAAATYRSVVDIERTTDGNYLILDSENMPTEFTLGVPAAGQYTFNDGDGYMYESAVKSVKNQADPFTWSITIDEDNIATIKATNELRYNSGSPRFTTYASGQQALQLFVKSDGKQAAGLAWSTDAVELTAGDEFTAPTLTNPNNLTVTIASNNTELATVEGGVVSLVENATGTATITASFEGDDTYRAASVSYTITVNSAEPPTPPTYDYALVTDAAQLQDGLKVIIVASGADKAAGAAAATYREVVDVERTTDGNYLILDSENMPTEFTLGVPAAGQYTFNDGDGYMYESAAKSVKVQADPFNWSITIGEGNIATIQATNELRYNSGSPRFTTYASGQQALQLYVKNDGKQAAGLAWSANAVELTVGDEFEAPTLTNPNNLTVTIASNNTELATVENGVVSLVENATGTAKITASYAGDDTYRAASVSYTITVSEEVVPPTPQPDAEAKVIVVTYNNKFYAMSTTIKNGTGFEPIEVEKEGGKIIVKSEAEKAAIQWQMAVGESTATFQNSENKYLACGTGSNTELALLDEVSEWAWDAEANCYKQPGKDSKGRTFYYNYNSGNPIFRAYTVNGIGAEGYSGAPEFIAAENIEVRLPYESVRTGLTSGFYYTMCLEKAVTNVRGASIWKVLSKAQNGTDIILEEVKGTLDAGRPYFFYATADKMDVVYTGDAVGAPLTEGNNGLVGSFEQALITQSNTNFILYNNMLYYVDSEAYVGAHRAYLNMNGVPAYNSGAAPAPDRRRVTMQTNGEQVATGMDEVNVSETAVKMIIDGQLFILRGEKMYDATGRLVK